MLWVVPRVVSSRDKGFASAPRHTAILLHGGQHDLAIALQEAVGVAESATILLHRRQDDLAVAFHVGRGVLECVPVLPHREEVNHALCTLQLVRCVRLASQTCGLE
eukprot:1476633-Prymnesium_polylepis.1